jgi:hypothetical protein
MTSLRSFLCLTLLVASAASAFARPVSITNRATPHSLWATSSSFHDPGNPSDDYANVRVNHDPTTEVQDEEQACISPIDANVMVAVWKDYSSGSRRVGFAYSHDAGLTWTDALFPQMYYDCQSDPSLVVDAQGIFTASIITFPADANRTHIIQVSSYDGGVTWQDSVWVVHYPLLPHFEDKQMLAVDDVPGSPYLGSYYCTWTRSYNYPSGDSVRINVVYKRPGQPYSEPCIVNQDSNPRWNIKWSNVCVGVEGKVYVSWLAYDMPSDGRRIEMAHSLDGGDTWSQEQVVVSTRFIEHTIDPILLIMAYGALAADVSDGPYHGRLYMIFTDGDSANTETDVFTMHSDDDGTTWSPRDTICDEPSSYPVDQFHPWISVDEEGRVWCVFYDRRNDPNNLLMDTYFTVSTDGGDTWRANERISTVSSDPGAGQFHADAGLIGEYIGWQARGGKALAVWTDTRNGNQDVYSAVVDSVFPPDDADEPPAVLPAQISLRVSPNPTNGTATLNFELARESVITFRVYDITGRLAQELDLGEMSAGEHRVNVSLDGMATGIYLAELTTHNTVVRTKLVLLR